jgi:hypothetical protein
MGRFELVFLNKSGLESADCTGRALAGADK